jgi:hypothetical protein
MNACRRRATELAWLLLGALPLLTSNLPAAAPRDLGQQLAYVRLHRFPDDAAALAAAWKSPALIVDLRYPEGPPPPAFGTGLPARTAPLFVLVGPATPAPVLAALRARAPALVSVGRPGPGCVPDIALDVKPEDDRRAFDALESGTPVESLISDTGAKRRFDEAELARGHGHNPDGAAGENPAATAPTVPAAAAAPVPDLILRRAVEIHRALLALGRLPHR